MFSVPIIFFFFFSHGAKILCALDGYLEKPKTVKESLTDGDNKTGRDRESSRLTKAFVTNI